MTREEAYSRIDAIIAKYEIDEEYVTITSTLDYDALRIARKALEQEPCKDAIGREDMLDAIGHGTTYTSEELQKIIKALPPVNPQPKMGYWIKIKSGDKDFPESIVCSRCGNENSHLDFNENAEPIGKVFVTSKFCPNCGIRMVNPQERSGEE